MTTTAKARTPALLQGVLRVHDARTQLADVTAIIKARRAEFEQSIAHLVESQKELTATVASAEEGLRAEALAAYRATKDRAPVAGVEIKLFKVMAYDPPRALEWAKKTGMCLIPEQLDEDAFAKVAKATPLDFVLYDDEPKATIAKDLGKALAVEALTATPTPAPADREPDPF